MDVKQSLISSVEEVLDKMAFMYFEDLEDTPPDDSEFDFITQVTFEGMIRGTLNIMMKKTVAHEVTYNLLGIREDDDLFEGTQIDALKEFTNLVMGRTMTILNPHGRFDMSVPSIVNSFKPVEPGETELIVDGAMEEEPMRIRMNYIET